jgi:uncharacterized membrane protein HdeD (DUF308 family)
MEPLSATSRWGLALRGIAAIIFGLIVWTWPHMVLHVLVLIFGIFAIASGIFAILAGVRADTSRSRWLLIAEGVLAVLAGIVALGWPAITAVALLFLIALWAIVTGVVEIIGAFGTGGAGGVEWLLILSGVISIIFGILLFVWPHLGLLALVWLIGIYAVIYGVIMLVRAISGEAPRPYTTTGGIPNAPTGGIPTP